MAKKKSAKSKGQRTPSKRKTGAGLRATARSAGGRRKTAGARTPAGKARRKSAKNPPRPGKRGATARKSGASRAKAAKASGKRTTRKPATGGSRKSAKSRLVRRGGTGRESELAQTPETGRTVTGRTNPMKTVRSTGKPAGAGDSRQAPALNRARKQLREIEESVEGPPSSLNMDRTPSAASSGRRHLKQTLDETNETGPVLTGGDVDADWGDAYAVGDEAPGGDNPTPDQDIVDDIGKALGVEYQDNEELKGADKLTERDKHRWELDPASSDDYLDRE